MTIEETKPAVQSKVIWGNTATIVSVIVGAVVAYTHVPSDLVDPVLVPLVTAGVGALFSLVSRLSTDTKISGWFK